MLFRYDDTCGKYLGEYPDFEEEPRYTKGGKMWITAMQSACQHACNKHSGEMGCEDCGSCSLFCKEHPGDLVGVCEHERNCKTIA